MEHHASLWLHFNEIPPQSIKFNITFSFLMRFMASVLNYAMPKSNFTPNICWNNQVKCESVINWCYKRKWVLIDTEYRRELDPFPANHLQLSSTIMDQQVNQQL